MGGAEWLRRQQKRPNSTTNTFFNTVHLLPTGLRFEHRGAKLASCPGSYLTSLRPCLRTIVGVQHQYWTVVILLGRQGHHLLSRITVTWRPARVTRQHRTPTTPPKAFHEEPGHILSRSRQNMCIGLWHAPRISWKFAEEWKSVL